MVEKELIELTRLRAQYLLIDLTGLSSLDNYIIHGLYNLIKAVRIIGGETFLVGIYPELGMEMTKYSLDILEGIKSYANLQQGVEYAISQNGYKLVKNT